jgi:hypothetical protein
MPPRAAAGAAKAAVLPEVASGGPAGPSGGLAPPRFGGMPGTVHRDRVKATNLAATNRYTGKSRKVRHINIAGMDVCGACSSKGCVPLLAPHHPMPGAKVHMLPMRSKVHNVRLLSPAGGALSVT